MMKKKYICIILILSLFSNCSSSKKNIASMKTLNLFKEIITGNFDNKNQIDEEIKLGKQIHPFAKHINRIVDAKIKNLPIDKKSFFILEESYYENPGKPVDIKPYLFQFSAGNKNTVVLKVFQLPTNIDKKDIRNDNKNLEFNYNELTPSPTFKGAVYAYNKTESTFTTNTPTDLGNGMKFTLIETLSKNKLIVMELLEKDGKRLTAYDTPIIYDRK
jgi:hypothetical protein